MPKKSGITIATGLSITYRDFDQDPNDLCELVESALQEAASRGLFTDESDADVIEYRYDARPLHPIAHEDLVSWLTKQVQSSAISVDELIEKVASYGAMAPAEFFAEMHERMTPKSNGLPAEDDGLISEDVFRDEWGAHVQPNGDLFELDQVRNLPVNTVWTIVSGDNDGDDSWFAMPGFRWINRLGYCLTTKPWDDESLTAYWFKDDLEREDDEDQEADEDES